MYSQKLNKDFNGLDSNGPKQIGPLRQRSKAYHMRQATQQSQEEDTIEMQQPRQRRSRELKKAAVQKFNFSSKTPSPQKSDENKSKQVPVLTAKTLDSVSSSNDSSQLDKSNNKQKFKKKAKLDLSESVEEQEFEKYFKNPLERKQFDQTRQQLQTSEIKNINQFNLEKFGMKNLPVFKEATAPEILCDRDIEEMKSKSYATVALCCLTVTNPFRMVIINIVCENPLFDQFIILVIITNSIFMALNQEVSFVTDNQFAIDFAFLIIYSIEMILRIIAMGFITREFSYLRNLWNLNDFIVVIFGWIAVVTRNKTIEAAKIIRILRLIRAANQLPNMAQLLQTIFKSLPVLFDIGLLFFFILLMFGAVATQLLGGHFQNRCMVTNEQNQTSITLSDNVTNLICFKQLDCEQQQPAGINSSCQYYGNPFNGTFAYDNIILSVMNVFIIIKLEGSYSMMYLTRQSEQTYAYDAFYVLCIMAGGFVVLNLLIAVQADYLDQAFNEEEESQREFLEKMEQRQVLILEHEKKQKKERQSDDESKSDVDEEINEENVEEAVLSFVSGKNKFLASQFYDSPSWLKIITDSANVTFMALFTIEMILKIFGLGIRGYVSDSFNLFDAFVVIMSYVDYYTPGDTPQIKMIRTFRLMRILKVLRNWGQLANIISTVLESLTSISNLTVLILLYLFIGALLCKYFFINLTLTDEVGVKSRYGFQNMTKSLINVFIILTGANWNDIMIQTIAAQENFAPAALFIPLLIIGNIFLLNLFLGILLRSIANLQDIEEEKSQNSEPEKSQEFKKSLEIKNTEQQSERNQQSLENDSFTIMQQITVRRPPLVNIEGETSSQNPSQSLNQSPSENHSQELSPSQNQSPSENHSQGLSPSQNQSPSENHSQRLSPSQNQSPSENHSQRLSPSENWSQKLSQSYNASESDDYREGGQSNPQLFEIDEEVGSSQSDLGEEFLEIQKRVITFITKNRQAHLNSQCETLTKISSIQITQKSEKQKSCWDELHANKNTFFCISPENPLRSFFIFLSQNTYFAGLIYHMIALNSVLLALQCPALTDQYQYQTIDFLLNFISGIFIGEFVIKVIAQGFYFGEKSYLKDPWNRLDFIIVGFCIIGWLMEAFLDANINSVKSLRSLRALRPLRVISSNEGMKIVVNCLFESLPTLFNVLLIVILFVFIFGVLGIQLLVGQLGQCNNTDPQITNKTLCTGNYTVDSLDYFGNFVEKESVPMLWIPPLNRYDNIFQSMMTFFEVATLENWVVPMFQAIDAKGYDQAPVQDYNQSIVILFVFYIFFQTFFIMSLFVSVIVDTFNEEILKNAGADQFNEVQKEWVGIQKLLLNTDPKIIPVEPANPLRLFCFRLIQQKYFEYTLMTLIGINSIFLLIDSEGLSESLIVTLVNANFIFTSFFTFELIMKILGFGFKYYWYINWNKFDFIIVFFSLLSINEGLLNQIGIKSSTLKIIRIARLLKIIKTVSGLAQLLKTLLMSMTNIMNTGALLVLILFTFSIAGMSLFGDQPYSEFYNKDANFTTFYLSMQLLFRTAVGGDWNGLMHDNYQQYGLISMVYWLLFVLCVILIFLNVFIAVIAESFNENSAADNENELLTFKKKDIKAFQNTWARFCPLGELYLKTELLVQFLQELPPPLGYYGIRLSVVKIKKVIYCLNIRDHKGFVYYPEVLWAIFHSLGGFNDEKVVNCEQIRKVVKLVKKKYTALLKPVTLDSLCANKHYENELTACKYIQAYAIMHNYLELKKYRIEKQLKEKQKKLEEQEIDKDQEDQEEDNFNGQLDRDQIIMDRTEEIESNQF